MTAKIELPKMARRATIMELLFRIEKIKRRTGWIRFFLGMALGAAATAWRINC